jgi:predicted permease
MLQVLVDVLVPVFAVVAIGFGLSRWVGIEPRALATLAYWVLGPAFIFDVLATAELDPDVVAKVVVATAAVMLVAGLVAALIMRAVGSSFSELAATVLTSTYGNAGNFGLAISAFAFGEEALPVASIVMVTVNTLGIITGVGLASLRRGSLLGATLTAVSSPLALAVVPALVVNLTDADMPVFLDRPITLMAAALIPVMLLTLGVQLAGIRRTLPSPRLGIPIAVKLVLSPAVAALAVALFDLGGLPADVVVLQAAMPAAVFTSLIAIEHELEADYVTSIVLLGTLVSAVTLPVVITLL